MCCQTRSPENGQFHGSNYRLGSRGDSYYEYLLKVWLQQDKRPTFLREQYDKAMAGVKARLLGRSKPNGLLFVGELPDGAQGAMSPKMDHLVSANPPQVQGNNE